MYLGVGVREMRGGAEVEKGENGRMLVQSTLKYMYMYLYLAYLKQPLILTRKSGPCFNMEI